MDDSPKDHFSELIGSLRSYVETRTEILKLQLIDKAGTLAGGIVTFIIMVVLISIVVIFLSIAAALIISDYFDERWIGFAIVGGFYGLIALVIYAGRDHFVNRPVTNKFIKNIFSDEEEEEN